MEITLQLFEKHRFADRGFLIGPYCPIYGVGSLLITFFLTGFENHPIVLFSVTVVLCAILEYLTSFVMEKLFHARWWDYSNMKFNINGRICLETIIPFGILGLIIIYFVNPFVFDILAEVPETTLNIIAIIIGVIFAVDLLVSLKVILNFSATTKKIDEENPKDNTEEISKKVKEFLRGESILNRRLVNAFPKLTAIIKKNSEKIKQKTEEVKEELANKASVMKEEFANRATEMKEDFSERANEVKQGFNEKTEKMKNDVKDGINKTSKTVRVNIKMAKRKAKRQRKTN